MSAIEVECPECSRRLRLSAEDRDKSIRCPVCRCLFSIKSAQTVAPSAKRTDSAASSGRTSPRPANRGKRTDKSTPPEKNRRVRKSVRSTRSAAKGPDRNEDPWEALPDEHLFDADFNSYADVEAYDDPPSPRRRKRRRSSRSDPIKVLLFLVMGMVGIGAVGGIGYALYQFLPSVGFGGFSGFGNVVDLSYMPQQIEAFARVEVDQVITAPIIQPLLNANPEFRTAITGFADTSEFQPEDIDSLTFGFWQRNPAASGARSNEVIPFATGNDNTEFLMVLRSHRPLSNENFGLGEDDEYQGTPFLSRGDFSVWWPDSYTAVFGSREALIQSIQQGGTTHRFAKFDFVDSGYDVIFAGAGALDSMAPLGGSTPSLNRLQASLNQSARGFALGVDVGSSVEANVQFWCRNAAQASALAAEMTSSIEDGKAEIDQSRSNPMLMPIITQIDSVMDSLSVNQSGDVVRLKASVQKSTVDTLVQFSRMMR